MLLLLCMSTASFAAMADTGSMSAADANASAFHNPHE
jgi:hypothetical protein